mgnify:CR=1 FL=1
MLLIDKYRDDIAQLCRIYGVKKLYVFGSVLNDSDFTAESDIDLAVVFDRSEIKGSFDRYMDFKFSLEALLGRPVDLVSLGCPRNTCFLRELNAAKELIYAA